MDFATLPGYELVQQGLEDLRAGNHSEAAMLVLIGRDRLRGVGINVPAASISEPDHALYDLLASIHGDDAHSQYNALIRRLVSFERAAECATE